MSDVFELGNLWLTSGFVSMFGCDRAAMFAARDKAEALIARHRKMDWGERRLEDREMNNLAVLHGEGQILSKYTVSGADVYVVTDSDRSKTTVLLAGDY